MRFRRLNDLAALKVAFLRYYAFFVATSGTGGGIDDVPQLYSFVLQMFVVEGT